jgi:hypothetical protein
MASRPNLTPTTPSARAYPLSTSNGASDALSNTDMDTYTNSTPNTYPISNASENMSSDTATSPRLYDSDNPVGTATTVPATVQTSLETAVTTRSILELPIQYLRHTWTGFKQGPFRLPIAAMKRTGSGLRTVIRSYGKITVLLGMVLATILSVPSWRGLQLQIWTSKKDFFEYCKGELVSNVEKKDTQDF